MNIFPAWAAMWILAGSVYAVCKVLTLCDAVGISGIGRPLAYLFVWPGMNAREFLGRDHIGAHASFREWFAGITKLILGAALLWIGVRNVSPSHELLRGWVGMVGLILVLHFGAFHLLALWFRDRGIHAEPLMNPPLKARSVAEFWSVRWNTAFNRLAHRFVLRRLVPRIGIGAAVLVTFCVSGLVHDLVISVPAGGGYGLPTVYFLIQGMAVLIERSRFGRVTGLSKGFVGHTFTMVVTAGPAFWLFHPLFVRNVMLPFLRAIGCW